MDTNERVADIVDTALEATVVLSFTRLGIAARRHLDDWHDDVESRPLAGRSVAVTGATSGLGEATATALAARGASVWLVVRDRTRAEATRQRIAEETGNDDIGIVLADLADLATVRDAAGELAANVPALHALVHNAGALTDTRTMTADGIELTLQTHVVAPFLLTTLLLPQLTAAGGRVVSVSSGGMYTQSLEIDDLQSEHDYNGSTAYARAKRAQVLLTEEWAERLAGTGVTAHAMHPGWADTPGVESSLPLFHQITGPLLRSPEEGADTIVWLVGEDPDTIGSGGFWMDRRRRSTHKVPWTRRGDADRSELWDRVTDLAGTGPVTIVT
ncbi:MAG: SDR family NAD(P)-dependent oxidoreductase [Acidimicrobiales bacterium]